MDKTTLLQTIRISRAHWETLLAQLNSAKMTKPGVCGEWSVKDIIAHLTWHEREIASVLKQHALVGSELWNLPLDERNDIIFQENKDRSLEDVLADAQRVFTDLLQCLETLTEQQLHEPGLFTNMPMDCKPWQLIAENTYEHYQDHSLQIIAWQARH